MKIDFFKKYTTYPIDICERADKHLENLIEIALLEDGRDCSAEAIFSPNSRNTVCIVTKEDSFAVGLPLIPMIIEKLIELPSVYTYANTENAYTYEQKVKEASFCTKGSILCTLEASTILILKVERVVLNFITHLSGIANLTNKFVKELENTDVKLLDTRKTLPAHRYLEKYAVLAGGAQNHRLALDDMIMLKDNHIDALGSIQKAVSKAREQSELKIEVECRNIEEVKEAITAKADRIMLDNMNIATLEEVLPLIPSHIEAEISGNVSLDNIRALALSSKVRKPDFISVGKITHSAPIADFSLKQYTKEKE